MVAAILGKQYQVGDNQNGVSPHLAVHYLYQEHALVFDRNVDFLRVPGMQVGSHGLQERENQLLLVKDRRFGEVSR